MGANQSEEVKKKRGSEGFVETVVCWFLQKIRTIEETNSQALAGSVGIRVERGGCVLCFCCY